MQSDEEYFRACSDELVIYLALTALVYGSMILLGWFFMTGELLYLFSGAISGALYAVGSSKFSKSDF